MTDEPDLAAAADPPPDGDLRVALRDLLPDYHGPADPLLRVGASIRRRRSRRQALFAIGSAAAAALLVTGVPALLGGIGPTGGAPPAATGTDPASADPAVPLPPPLVHPVNQGVIAGSRWQVGSTAPGGTARRCLLTEGAGFDRDLACFDEWQPGRPASWQARVVRVGGQPVTQVIGVAPAAAATVEIRFATGRPVEVPAVPTATDPVARFFAVLLAGDRPVRSVTALRPDGAALGPPVTEPAPTSCRPAPDNACAAAEPTG